MGFMNFDVTHYTVSMGRELTKGNGYYRFYAYIVCYGAQDETYVIYFMHSGSPIPNNYYDPSRKLGTCYVPSFQFPWYIDLLRNEKPVKVHLTDRNENWNRLYTGKEPVGEGEDIDS